MLAHRFSEGLLGSLAFDLGCDEPDLVPVGQTRLVFGEEKRSLGDVAHLLHHAYAGIDDVALPFHLLDALLSIFEEQLGRSIVEVFLDLLHGHAGVEEEADDVEHVELLERIVPVSVFAHFFRLEEADLVVVDEQFSADVAHLSELP